MSMKDIEFIEFNDRGIKDIFIPRAFQVLIVRITITELEMLNRDT